MPRAPIRAPGRPPAGLGRLQALILRLRHPPAWEVLEALEVSVALGPARLQEQSPRLRLRLDSVVLGASEVLVALGLGRLRALNLRLRLPPGLEALGALDLRAAQVRWDPSEADLRLALDRCRRWEASSRGCFRLALRLRSLLRYCPG